MMLATTQHAAATNMKVKQPLTDKDVTAVVLAGGRARRMGGEDKGLIEVGGRAMVQWVACAMARQCATVFVNANRNRERYHKLTGCRVLSDMRRRFAPLTRLTSMRWSGSKLLKRAGPGTSFSRPSITMGFASGTLL